MKITSGSWNETRFRNRRYSYDPSVDDDIADDSISVAAFMAGLTGLGFAVIIFAGLLFAVVQILNWQNVIDFTVGWGASLLLALIYVFGRSIDKAFFRDRTF